jgi:hypothetical protein
MAKKPNMKLLAEFVEEGLAGLGVLDDADELIGSVFDESGEEAARDTMLRYNNAIVFVNTHTDENLKPITEQQFSDWTEQ